MKWEDSKGNGEEGMSGVCCGIGLRSGLSTPQGMQGSTEELQRGP